MLSELHLKFHSETGTHAVNMTNWLTCPSCGHRERPNNETTENALTNYEHDRIKRRNKNLNQFNDDRDY